ncbi:acyltransferase [Vibrio sp. 2-Bac 85]
MNIKRYHVLDSFRGLCAVAIVIHHLNIVGSISENVFFINADVFVDFFFVLSGFVLSVSNRDIQPRKFLISRVFRLFPLHIAMLIVFLCLELAKYIGSTKGLHFSQVPFSGKNALDQIIPNLFLVQSWSESFRHTSFNFPSWSISVELFLYMSFIIYAFFTRPSIVFGFSFCILGALLLFFDVLSVHLAKGVFCFYFGVCVSEMHRKISVLNMNKGLASLLEFVVLGLVVILIFFKSYIVGSSLFIFILFVITFGMTIFIYSSEM